ncbi:MAG: hypothetical protein KZQ89_18500 [Candidatus Thiodiazotropha sp. (ex Lucinoma kastoroae)]|nr:hypothetical protein [Candidatus Thiodiazotropha sp. (ex Lucinoma kastoroae)]MCU7859454.1 hypothetical protein [Candidatus Thiodiazotropha sp. (ex Lucinoma kastoroae)]
MESEDLQQQSGPPVSVMMSRMPLPGKEREFETYLNGIAEAAQRHPGHLGVSIIRPSGQEKNYYILFEFDRRSNLEPYPLMLRTLILTGMAVPLMTFLLMPLLTRVFKNWLYS